jgi:hypothetical protein
MNNTKGLISDPLAALREVFLDRTDVEGVWNLRMPRLPWKAGAAERERRQFLTELEHTFPHRALFLSDPADGGSPRWQIIDREDDLSRWESDFAKGAWVLVFSQNKSSNDFANVTPTMPSDYATALEVVRSLGVDVAIWSWFDDNEWLLVAPGGP